MDLLELIIFMTVVGTQRGEHTFAYEKYNILIIRVVTRGTAKLGTTLETCSRVR